MHSQVRELLRRHGSETVSFQVLEPGLRYWIAPDGDAAVAYADTGGAWVAAGSPICAPERRSDVAARFAEAAAEARRRPRFFASEVELDGWSAMPIGQQPHWTPGEWPQALRGKRSLREQLRRARAKGVGVREVSAETLREGEETRRAIEELASRWQQTRKMAPMRFLVTLDLFSHAEERTYLLAERDGDVVGILIAVPVYARDGWFLEDVLRAPHAPNGTIELLFDRAMCLAAERGVSDVSFGLAPLAEVESRWLGAVRRRTRWLYDFDGLRAFKQKLQPSRWTPIHLVYPRGTRGALAIIDSLKAFAGGSFLRFGWRTLVHLGPRLAWILAALLIPWTVLLAAAPVDLWFPSWAARAGWITYDAVLFALFTALAIRFRPFLVRVAAVAAGLDVAVGTTQLLLFNAPRIEEGWQWLLALLALAAPLFACVLLFASARAQASIHAAHNDVDQRSTT